VPFNTFAGMVFLLAGPGCAWVGITKFRANRAGVPIADAHAPNAPRLWTPLESWPWLTAWTLIAATFVGLGLTTLR
jgi:hypothetical protein